jgi:uncharacterized protein YoxC
MEIIISISMHIIFIAFCIYIGYTIGRRQEEIKQTIKTLK